MINISLCFKDDTERHFIHTEIYNCFDRRGIECNIFCCRNAQTLMKNAQRRRPDILFYDLGAEYGLMRLAALALKKTNPKLVSVVFHDKTYTATEDDLLLEPLYIAPNKSQKQLWNYACLAYEAAFDRENTFSYYKRPTYLHIPFDNILYFVSEARKIRIVCADGSGQGNFFYAKLGDVEELTADSSSTFLRIHQSYLINEDYVDAYNRTHVTLSNGELLPISKYEYYKKIKDRLSEKKVRFPYGPRA